MFWLMPQSLDEKDHGFRSQQNPLTLNIFQIRVLIILFNSLNKGLFAQMPHDFYSNWRFAPYLFFLSIMPPHVSFHWHLFIKVPPEVGGTF